MISKTFMIEFDRNRVGIWFKYDVFLKLPFPSKKCVQSEFINLRYYAAKHSTDRRDSRNRVNDLIKFNACAMCHIISREEGPEMENVVFV
jgi:hypothetical protein